MAAIFLVCIQAAPIRGMILPYDALAGWRMIPAFTQDGLLPRGRFVATVEEIEDALINAPEFAASTTRSQVWSDFIDVVALIKHQRVKVPAAFVSGSFVSNSLDPSDVDTSLIVDTSRIMSPATLNAVSKIARDTKTNGYKVDAFIIQWFPDGTALGGDPFYVRTRGQWDDFWQRFVPDKLDRDFPQRAHAIPKRGYLEVILDGYV